MIQINEDDVLVIVDAQRDFCPGGALPVPGGDEVMPLINALSQRFARAVATQDWHPPNQVSFASAHGKAPFSVVSLDYGDQVLWPDHCVQGTPGADFHPALDLTRAEVIVRKGANPHVDSYSAFFENDRKTPTGLAGYLHERGLRRCFFVGLALDFCVRYSAEDAVREGFEAVVVLDACRAIAMPSEQGSGSSLDEALASFAGKGVLQIRSTDLSQGTEQLRP